LRTSPPFHRYLPSLSPSDPWGIAVTAGGYYSSRPRSAYPGTGHPADHFFTWEKGRVLASCQVIYIRTGQGTLETRAAGTLPVPTGSAMLLGPGMWHRYAPDPATGWEEMWIELQGSIIGQLQKSGVLNERKPVLEVASPIEFGALVEAVHARLRDEPVAAHDPERAALGLQVLSLLLARPRRKASDRAIDLAVARAERILAEHVAAPPDMPAIARELGVAYSYFRREFKARTGVAPRQYLQRLRLEQARRLLGASSYTLEDIAGRLGFSSAFHLSAAFKQRYGEAPAHWRRAARVGAA